MEGSGVPGRPSAHPSLPTWLGRLMSGVDDTYSKVQGMGLGDGFQRVRVGQVLKGNGSPPWSFRAPPAAPKGGPRDCHSKRGKNEVQKDIVRYCLDV